MILVSAPFINSFCKVCFSKLFSFFNNFFKKNFEQFISLWLVITQPALDTLQWIWTDFYIRIITFVILFFGHFVNFFNFFLKKIVYITVIGVRLSFGISCVDRTSTNVFNYNFDCQSKQLSNIIKFKVLSVKLPSFMCLQSSFLRWNYWRRMLWSSVQMQWCFIS